MDCERELPGFRPFNAFFAELKGAFEPVACTEDERRGYVEALQTLAGTPAQEFHTLREDLALTAKVREVRRYGEERTFVRFEFKRLGSDCTWSPPYQLMAVFDDLGTLVCYTVLAERGLFKEGLLYRLTKVRCDWSDFEETDDLVKALTLLDTEDEPEVQVVDRATGRPFAYVYGGTGPRKCAFDIEWYVGCEPWILALGNVGFAATEELLFTLKDGGVKAFEDAADWRAFDFRASYERHGVPFNIDRGLRRALERAKRGGDANVERTIRALGIGEDRVSDPYTLRVKAQTRKGMLNEIFNLSCDAECGDTRKAKLLAYLAEGGDVPSLNNLGYLFHFGMGVKTDYDLAVYWHLRGAEAGDHYSMLSLGKIFSEKNSPRWDGPKAVEWFEKAIASGDDWAKGELGHCLLCGRCVETDFERAESLLEEAVEACPDRADFAENLEKARNRESI